MPPAPACLHRHAVSTLCKRHSRGLKRALPQLQQRHRSSSSSSSFSPPPPPIGAHQPDHHVNNHHPGSPDDHHPLLRLSEPVRRALREGRPVVALESTIISHGMPYPENLQMAREVEAIITKQGVVPATVAIMGGKIRVGLSEEQLEGLAREGPKAVKCSKRDIPVALSKGWVGATTVAATMTAAAMAGIPVFVTGGIGGVHRGGEVTMDVSADLVELGRCPVAVVCAGIKSILDIDKTLEVLETQGVPVLCYGSDRFPAFFTPDSGLPAPVRVDSPEEVASIIHHQHLLAAPAPSSPPPLPGASGGGGGLLLAVPNPEPSGAARTQAAIDDALSAAAALGLRGKAVTPFILQRVAQASGGDSLRANIALVKHNAHIGAEVAKALAHLRTTGGGQQEEEEEVGASKGVGGEMKTEMKVPGALVRREG